MVDDIRLSRGLWRAPEDVADLAARCAALLTVLPPRTVIAGHTAGCLHGLWLPDRDVAPDRVIEVILYREFTLPRELPGSRRAEVGGRRRTLHPDDVTMVDGVPATSLARTWCDLAESLTLTDLVAAGDCVLGKAVGIHEVDAVLARAAHRRGIVKARHARGLLDGRSRSRPESHLRCSLVLAGLPHPEVNAPVYDADGGWLAEPDLLYRRARLALEYNGALHAEPIRMRRDITRSLDLARAGWTVLTFGPREVFGRPDQVAALVRAELARRRPELLRRTG